MRLQILAAIALIASPLRAQSVPGAVPAKAEPHHHQVFEDATLRVLRVRVQPKDSTLLHEHVADYFWIALGASEIVNAKPGVPDATIKSQDMSIHYTPGKFAHVARNTGANPFDNITVELLGKQTNVRNLCEPALAKGPLDCPPPKGYELGVVHDPAFTTDQLRVSVVTMAPGSSISTASDGRSAWVIALDTLEATNDLSLGKPGRWVGGVFKSTPSVPWSMQNHGKAAVAVLVVTPRR